MVKGDYFKRAGDSVVLLTKNPVLYVPDIIYYAFTALLAFLFLYSNDLTIIFSNMALFNERLRDVVASPNLLKRLIFSLVIFILFNILVGIGTISLRYTLVKRALENKKANFIAAYKTAPQFIFSVLWIKIFVTLINLAPIIVFGVIAFFYRALLIPMILLGVLSIIFLRFVFLFIYPTLFLKTGSGAIKTIKQAVDYFNRRTKHVLLTGIFVFIVSILVSLASNKLFSSTITIFADITVLVGIGIVLKILIDITLILWSALFLFKSY